MKVQTFSFKGFDIDIMLNKGALAYVFYYGGKKYGNAVKLENRKTETIVSATFLLLSNALETYEKLNENNRPNTKA